MPGVTNDFPRKARRHSLAGFPAALLSAGAVVSQVLALATEKFQTTLNSDYLLAHAFARELFVSPYPVSGWKFGMGSFAFHDYAIYLTWFGVFGDSGGSVPSYAATLWLGYFAAFAWALRSAGVRWPGALAASGIAINLILAMRLLPGGYAERLWQLSLPAYHGGNLLLELCCFALIFGAVRAGEWTRSVRWSLGIIAALGTFSNAQLLLHVLIPTGVLLFFVGPAFGRGSDDVDSRGSEGGSGDAVRTGFGYRSFFRYTGSKVFPYRRGHAPAPALRSMFSGYTRVVGIALACAIAARVALALAEVFFFASLFKQWPLPWLMWDRLLKFLADFRTELLPGFPVMWAVALAGVVAGGALVLLSRRKGGAELFVPAAVLLSLLAVTVTPIAAVYWKDSGSMRYLLPWFVFPVWMLAYAAAGLPRRAGLVVSIAGLAVAGFFGVRAGSEIRREALRFPCPPESIGLRDYLRANNLRSGLCHFWEGHLLRNSWRYEGPRLAHIRDADFCEFWCNNAFGYFPVTERGLGVPEFDFLIMNHLDAGVLRERLGGDFTPVQVGPYSVVKLSAEQALRAAGLVERLALDFLSGRRADLVKSGLAKPTP